MNKVSIKVSRSARELLAEKKPLDIPLLWLVGNEECVHCKKQFKRMDGFVLRVNWEPGKKVSSYSVFWVCSPRHAVLYALQFHPRLLEWRYNTNYLLDQNGV